MGWNGSGTVVRSNGEYSGSNVWAQDLANSKKITAARHDVHDEDLADAIQACLNVDGENTMLADLDMGGNLLTNFGPQGDALEELTTANPTIAGQTTPGSPVYGSQGGYITRYGDLIVWNGIVGLTSLGGAAGNLTIPLPAAFPSETGITFGCTLQSVVGMDWGAAAGRQLFAYVDSSGDRIKFAYSTSINGGADVAPVIITVADCNATLTIQFQAMYRRNNA